eukprot:1191290-Prorocentrum_minimum.AAC.2
MAPSVPIMTGNGPVSPNNDRRWPNNDRKSVPIMNENGPVSRDPKRRHLSVRCDNGSAILFSNIIQQYYSAILFGDIISNIIYRQYYQQYYSAKLLSDIRSVRQNYDAPIRKACHLSRRFEKSRRFAMNRRINAAFRHEPSDQEKAAYLPLAGFPQAPLYVAHELLPQPGHLSRLRGKSNRLTRKLLQGTFAGMLSRWTNRTQDAR